MLTSKKQRVWEGPYSVRQNMPLWKKIILDIFIPEYLGQPWRYECNANVRKRLTKEEASKAGLWGGYWLKVEFHQYQDCQTIYPHWWRRRVSYVRVSKRLYNAKPFAIPIFYQYSRHHNLETSVRAKIAH